MSSKWKHKTRTNHRGGNPNRGLGFEALEQRQLLSATPTGSLDDMIIFVNGGHGIHYAGGWGTDRGMGTSQDFIEDIAAQDFMSLYAEYVFNAGATVVPLRPIGHQPNEVVVDTWQASFHGTWNTGGASDVFGFADYFGPSDSIKVPNHGFRTGAEITYRTTRPSDTLPILNSSVNDETRYVIVVDRDTIGLATSLADSTANPPIYVDLVRDSGVTGFLDAIIDRRNTPELTDDRFFLLNRESDINYGDVPYRYAMASTTETAYARFRPKMPEAGEYPVYAWAAATARSVPDQEYRIHHAAGETTVNVNHETIGGGYVYLGTYFFNSGSSGYVDVTNVSSNAGDYVVADAIRFGNGFGTETRGVTAASSGHLKEDEAALYWIEAQLGERSSNPITLPIVRERIIQAARVWPDHMIREASTTGADRIYVGWHTNGFGNVYPSSRGRGVETVVHSKSPTANQEALAGKIAAEVFTDIDANKSLFEVLPFPRQRNNGDGISRGDKGEVRNTGEFDSTIVEVGFHTNPDDIKLMLDPDYQQIATRAAYQGTVNFFHELDSNSPTTVSPDPIRNLRAEKLTSFTGRLSWDLPVVDGIGGDAPTEFRVYRSADGRAFGEPTIVGNQTSVVVPIQRNSVEYFRITSANAGGESLPSKVVAANSGLVSNSNVLIVDGFDRRDRLQAISRTVSKGSNSFDVLTAEHDLGNSFDYVVPHAEAIEAHSGKSTDISTVPDSAVSIKDLAPLKKGETYGVMRVDNNTFQLTTLGGTTPIEFSDRGGGGTHRLDLPGRYPIQFEPEKDLLDDPNTLGIQLNRIRAQNHNLQTGDTVTYQRSDAIDLTEFDIIVWISGEEGDGPTNKRTVALNDRQIESIDNYVDAGGHMF
ncbi:N-acetylmuramoyl-L-alanine amidase, partial [Planctomycetota bacterium]